MTARGRKSTNSLQPLFLAVTASSWLAQRFLIPFLFLKQLVVSFPLPIFLNRTPPRYVNFLFLFPFFPSILLWPVWLPVFSIEFVPNFILGSIQNSRFQLVLLIFLTSFNSNGKTNARDRKLKSGKRHLAFAPVWAGFFWVPFKIPDFSWFYSGFHPKFQISPYPPYVFYFFQF